MLSEVLTLIFLPVFGVIKICTCQVPDIAKLTSAAYVPLPRFLASATLSIYGIPGIAGINTFMLTAASLNISSAMAIVKELLPVVSGFSELRVTFVADELATFSNAAACNKLVPNNAIRKIFANVFILNPLYCYSKIILIVCEEFVRYNTL